MTYEEFQKQYELESENSYADLSKLDEDELLNIISGKKSCSFNFWEGQDNYQLWRALQAKGTTKSIEPLFQIISNLKNEYLIRYHACEALFKIAGLDDNELKGKVQYGLDANRAAVDQHAAIHELKEILKL